MKFSELSQANDSMQEPGYTLVVGGRQVETSEEVRLVSLVCELTAQAQAGYCYVEAELEPGGTGTDAWLSAFQVGASCTLSLGYGARRTTVFGGFLYDVSWSDPLEKETLGLEAVFLDVRGKLMLSAQADAGAARTMAQMLDGILNQPCCADIAASRTIAALPKDWDLPAQRPGTTDFEVACGAADFLCYEFYAFADELYFGKPRPVDRPVLTFDGPSGLMELRRSKTLAGQCAAVAVRGADDLGEPILARASRGTDSGFGTERIKGALSGEVCRPEAVVRTMAQAQYLSKAQMERRQRRGGGLSGRCVGLPELRPGRFVEATDLSQPVNGVYYLQTVRHTLDETGFETYFEAED